MKLARIAFGLGLCAVGVACSAGPAPAEGQLSSEMEQAIDTYVRLQTAPASPLADDAGPGNAGDRAGGGGGGLGGIDAVQLGSALKAGASSIPSGGAASGPTNAGSGGAGSPSFGGGAGSPTGAGNGGAAVGPAGIGGGATAFAEAACYMIGNLCRYVSRCVSSTELNAVCGVPASCPSFVAAALSKLNAPIPPQAAVVVRCFGDGLASAPCVRGDLGEGLQASFGRCGIPVSGTQAGR